MLMGTQEEESDNDSVFDESEEEDGMDWDELEEQVDLKGRASCL